MHRDVHDALAATDLTESRKRRIREQFNNPATVTYKALSEVIAAAVAEQAEEAADPRYQLHRELDACFYGTLEPRDPESGVARPGHRQDGWRHGVSHPFRALYRTSARTWDVQPTQDESRAQYEAIGRDIDAGAVVPLA